MLSKNIPEGWVRVRKRRSRGRRMFETFARAFIFFCKWKYNENVEPAEIRSAWNSKGMSGKCKMRLNPKVERKKIANHVKDFFFPKEYRNHWRNSYFRKKCHWHQCGHWIRGKSGRRRPGKRLWKVMVTWTRLAAEWIERNGWSQESFRKSNWLEGKVKEKEEGRWKMNKKESR